MGPSHEAGGPRYYGLHPAIVTDLEDPESLGRVQVSFPWLGEEGADVRAWATLLSPYAEDDQGFQFLPSIDTQVVVAFEAGDPRRPYVVGAAWNGVEAQPEAPSASNDKRLIKTRSGSVLEFDDTAGSTKITLSTSGGHELVFDEGGQEVSISHLNGAKIVIDASGKVDITGLSSVDINAALFNVHSGIAVFDGLIQCQTLITNSVVSPSYTPGAGNVW